MRRGELALVLVIAMLQLSMSVIPTYAITITSVKPEKGGRGDLIVVTGSGMTAGKTVELYWDLVQSWDGVAGLLNTTTARADGTFEVWFRVPEAVDGTHYLWVKDTLTGEFDYVEFIVIPEIEVSPSRGLPGDKVVVRGYGFSAGVNVTIGIYNIDGTYYEELTRAPSTNSLGSFNCTVEIPHLEYGDYIINATDARGVYAEEFFTVGPVIKLTPDSGPVGTVVEVRGRGFTPGAAIYTEDVAIDGIWCRVIDEAVIVGADGEFIMEIVIPQLWKVGDYQIYVTDGTYWSVADFEVTGLAEIEIKPRYGAPGEYVTIYGYNFTQIRGAEVEVYIEDVLIGTYQTDTNGRFNGTFIVPALASGVYNVFALQADYNINASVPFRIGLMCVIISPTEGETGTYVLITGTGFTAGDFWNATFDGIAITDATEPVAADGTIFYSFYVPMVEPGTYTITALDITTGIKINATFVVTATTTVELEPSQAPQGYNVTIRGYHFPDIEGDEPDFVLYNATDAILLDVRQGWDWPVMFDEDGNFTGWWIVPEWLDIGDYMMNITYTATFNGVSLDYTVQVPFTVTEEVIYCESRKTEYYIGETITFDIRCSFMKPDSYIEIYDPDGNLFWRTDPLSEDKWIKIDYYYTVPYYAQTAAGNPMELPIDAPTGRWSWIWYDWEDTMIANGTFMVMPAVYRIPLYTGWNLIGLPINLIDPSIEGIFAENLTKVKYIFGFDNVNKTFTYWIQGIGGPLRVLEPGKGYWVYVIEDFNQTIPYKIEG